MWAGDLNAFALTLAPFLLDTNKNSVLRSCKIYNRKECSMNFKPRWLATGIGSLPVLDPEEAVSLVLEYLPEIPIWPQLPQRGPVEGMVWQYSEGMPRIRADVKSNKIWIDAAGDLTP
ncbi:MAG: methionine synthase [Deltaproteobacteria bacterium]|nr:methionine synthase [Deltaproteobacteria bacterium]